jgi:Fic family protein
VEDEVDSPDSNADAAIPSPAALDAAYRPFPTFQEWAGGSEVDAATWSSYKAKLNQAKAEAQGGTFERAVEVAVRSAAVETGAIEGLYDTGRGFTYSVATQAIAWQAQIEAEGAEVRAHFDAQLAAYELVLDAATQANPVTEVMVRQLHEVATRNQDTYMAQTSQGPQRQALPKGEYKTLPNHVIQADGTPFSYAPVIDTPPEMGRLMSELRDDAFVNAHPVKQAAYVHYALVAIHPFADGNGRVARAVASVYLYRAASIPLVIFADQQLGYFDALGAADGGRFQPFNDFILARALDAIQLVVDQVREASSPAIATTIAELTRLLTSSGGLLHQEVDATAERLSQMVQSDLAKRVAALSLPGGVQVDVSASHQPSGRDVPPGYRTNLSGGHRLIVVTFRSLPPANAGVDYNVDVVIATDPNNAATFVVRHVDYPRSIEVRLSEIHPAETELLRVRVGTFAEGLIAQGLDALARVASNQLRESGYASPGDIRDLT